MKITLLIGKIYEIQEALGPNIKVVQTKFGRKLTLKIDPKERIAILTVPRFCSKKRAIDFVNNNMDWIINTLGRLPAIKEFKNGEKISLFGQTVQIIHNAEAKRGVWLVDDILYVSGKIEFLSRRVRDYIKKRAATEFYNRSTVLAEKIGCKVHGICIKDTKSRWGSCSSLNNINYNWRIALAPPYVIEYLIAHEVSHLKHQDHSTDFWQCVEFLYPEWKKGNEWLKKHGKLLYAYQ